MWIPGNQNFKRHPPSHGDLGSLIKTNASKDCMFSRVCMLIVSMTSEQSENTRRQFPTGFGKAVLGLAGCNVGNNVRTKNRGNYVKVTVVEGIAVAGVARGIGY